MSKKQHTMSAVAANYFLGDLNKWGFSLRNFSNASFSLGTINVSISSIRSGDKLLTGKSLSSKDALKPCDLFSDLGYSIELRLRCFCSWVASASFRSSSLRLTGFPFSIHSFHTVAGLFTKNGLSRFACAPIFFDLIFINKSYVKEPIFSSLQSKAIKNIQTHWSDKQYYAPFLFLSSLDLFRRSSFDTDWVALSKRSHSTSALPVRKGFSPLGFGKVVSSFGMRNRCVVDTINTNFSKDSTSIRA
jgi:hypothetical protein